MIEIKRWSLVIPAVLIALLPNLGCPACWPAYAGILSALGLGFLLSDANLLPITMVFLIVAVAALGFRAKSRHGYAPMFLGLAASVLVVFAKFILEESLSAYVGIGILILASLWNSWPQRTVKTLCLACAKGNEGSIEMAQNRSNTMTKRRKIKVFSAGCPTCDEAVLLLKRIACSSCDVEVLDMYDATVSKRAKQYSIHHVPAIVIDGELASCCSGSGVNEQTLRAAGVGTR